MSCNQSPPEYATEHKVKYRNQPDFCQYKSSKQLKYSGVISEHKVDYHHQPNSSQILKYVIFTSSDVLLALQVNSSMKYCKIVSESIKTMVSTSVMSQSIPTGYIPTGNPGENFLGELIPATRAIFLSNFLPRGKK